MQDQPEAIPYSEILVPLSRPELDELKKTRQKIIYGSILVFLIFFSICYYMKYESENSSSLPLPIVFGVFILSILGYLIWNFTRDINFGQKKIICGQIDEKKTYTKRSRSTSTSSSSSSTTYYYFIIAGKEITVDLNDYDKFHSGDTIEISMMPKSLRILKISLLQNNFTIQQDNNSFASNTNTATFKQQQIAKTIPLTNQDRSLIKARRNSHVYWTLGIGAFVGFVLFVFLSIGIFMLFLSKNVKTLFSILDIYIALASAIIGIILFIAYKKAKPFARDLSESRKKIMSAIIQDKERSSSSGKHTLQISGKSYSVSPEVFNQFQGGQSVLLHTAPHSDTFLFLETI